MKHISIYLLLVLCSFTSCGLIDMEFDPISQKVSNLSFAHDTIYAMRGDTFFLAPYLYPDTVDNSSFLMLSQDHDVVRIQTDTIIAAGEGSTSLVAISASAGVSDTCMVIVMPPWVTSPYQYLNDMVVYAHITLDGRTPSSRIQFCAFYKDEPRGQAVQLSAERALYCFRIYSDEFYVSSDSPGDEDFTFRAYDPLTMQVTTLQGYLRFSGDTYGKPSTPVEMAFKTSSK